MLNRVKIVHGILCTFCLLGLIQIISGSVSVKGVMADKYNFSSSRNTSSRVNTFTDAWIAANQARIALNRAMLRIQMNPVLFSDKNELNKIVDQGKGLVDKSKMKFGELNALPVSKGADLSTLATASENYKLYIGVLETALEFAGRGEAGNILKLNVQRYQDAMQNSFDDWRHTMQKVTDRGVSENEKIYSHTLWTVIMVSLSVIFLIGFCWYALYITFIRPLQNNMMHLDAISGGDLTTNIDISGNNEMSTLAKSIYEMQTSLVTTVSMVRTGADSIYSGAEQISSGSRDLSSRTEQQAASLEETAASMEQITATVRLNAESAHLAARLTGEASECATRGGEVVSSVAKTMDGIASSSAEMADIITTIESIAFQTNILALNAAVEAARAGEQGRAFAVVAGEVRTLAHRSAMAAKDIKILIERASERIVNGSSMAIQAGISMADIVNSVERVRDIMSGISSASDEQQMGIEQISTAVNEMDRVTQQNARLVEESASAVASLESQARRLNDSVRLFQINEIPQLNKC